MELFFGDSKYLIISSLVSFNACRINFQTGASECYNPDWSVSTDHFYYGAQKHAGPASVQECLDYCGQQAVGCVAVDVNLNETPPTCWVHLLTSDLVESNLYSQKGINSYRLVTRCADYPIQGKSRDSCQNYNISGDITRAIVKN